MRNEEGRPSKSEVRQRSKGIRAMKAAVLAAMDSFGTLGFTVIDRY